MNKSLIGPIPDPHLRTQLTSAAGSRLLIPLYQHTVSAGFPSPADDYVEQTLDPVSLLIKRPAATFFVRVAGPSMIEAGIKDGSYLVVDRSITPVADTIVIAAIQGGLTVKQLIQPRPGQWCLAAANPAFADIPIDPEEGAHIWGVATWALTPLCSR